MDEWISISKWFLYIIFFIKISIKEWLIDFLEINHKFQNKQNKNHLNIVFLFWFEKLYLLKTHSTSQFKVLVLSRLVCLFTGAAITIDGIKFFFFIDAVIIVTLIHWLRDLDDDATGDGEWMIFIFHDEMMMVLGFITKNSFCNVVISFELKWF